MPSQARTWDTRDKEAYAIVAALKKWAGCIVLQPVLVLTDHKTLQSWVIETLSHQVVLQVDEQDGAKSLVGS